MSGIERNAARRVGRGGGTALASVFAACALFAIAMPAAGQSRPSQVADIGPGAESGLVEGRLEGPCPSPPFFSLPGFFVEASAGVLFFTANDGATGAELWRTDLETGGARMVADIAPGADWGLGWVSGCFDSQPKAAFHDGVLYFAADDGVHGVEPWRSDGTAAGTHMIVDLFPGPEDSLPVDFTRLGDGVIFTATGQVVGRELWRTDGTEAGTTLVADLRPDGWSTPRNFMQTEDTLYLWASTGPEGRRHIWRTRGVPGDAEAVPLGANVERESQRVVASAEDQVFAIAADDLISFDLWRIGASTNERVLADIADGSVLDEDFIAVGRRLFFSRRQPTGTLSSLWVSDGTRLGTRRVGIDAFLGRPLGAIGDRLLFVRNDTDLGSTLWQTDGTAEGTSFVLDLDPATERTPIRHVLPFPGDRLLLAFARSPDDIALVVVDGTPGNRVDLGALCPPGIDCRPTDLTRFGDRLVFAATEPASGRELWTKDDLGFDVVPIPTLDLSGLLFFFSILTGAGIWVLRGRDR